MDGWRKTILAAEAGSEDAETLVASAYIYSKLTLPLDTSARRLYIKKFSGQNQQLPIDEEFGRNVAEKVVNRFIQRIGRDGQGSDYAWELYSSPARNHPSILYTGKSRFIDEYYLCWDLAALFYKERNFVTAGQLFASALSLQDMFCTVSEVQGKGKDACNLTMREIAVALYQRGRASENGLNGLPVNHGAAADCYTWAAKNGNAAAKYALGVMLYEGRPGVDKNLRESHRLMKEAAEAGNKNAEDFLETAEYPSKKPQVVNIHVDKIDVDKGVHVGNGNFINDSTLKGG